MVKVYKDTTYIFAVAMQNAPSTARITVNDVHQSSARVIGEARNISISQGSFEDQFQGYGVHLYQIP
jgi:hypothetical protein